MTGVKRKSHHRAQNEKYYEHVDQPHEPIEVAADDPAALIRIDDVRKLFLRITDQGGVELVDILRKIRGELVQIHLSLRRQNTFHGEAEFSFVNSTSPKELQSTCEAKRLFCPALGNSARSAHARKVRSRRRR